MSYTPAFVTAKLVDLALVTLYYLFFGVLFSVVLQMMTRFYDAYTPGAKSTPRLFLEIVANIFFVTATFWVIRNLVERIPFPLDGMGGYRHKYLSSTTLYSITALTLILFQTSLQEKIGVLNNRLFQKTKAL
jgi:TRAP-type C4-dicarboxylate transport system permease small subunit